MLSTLGVIIGVAALVAVLALGDGMEQLGRQEIERTTDIQTVVLSPQLSEELDGQTVPRSDYPVFTPDDASELARLPAVAAVSLTVSGAAAVDGPHGTRRPASVVANSRWRRGLPAAPVRRRALLHGCGGGAGRRCGGSVAQAGGGACP
jgi:putative ABC transport system permease protein